MDVQTLTTSLGATLTSPVTSLRIGRIESEEARKVLIQNIPKMNHLKMLELEFGHFRNQSNRDLMLALKKNPSLTKVVGVVDDEINNESPLFSGAQSSVLNAYAARNETIAQMAKNPRSVQRCAWPSVLEKANQIENGSGAVFRFLMEAGESVGGQGKRHRKRTRFFEPTW